MTNEYSVNYHPSTYLGLTLTLHPHIFIDP